MSSWSTKIETLYTPLPTKIWTNVRFEFLYARKSVWSVGGSEYLSRVHDLRRCEWQYVNKHVQRKNVHEIRWTNGAARVFICAKKCMKCGRGVSIFREFMICEDANDNLLPTKKCAWNKMGEWRRSSFYMHEKVYEVWGVSEYLSRVHDLRRCEWQSLINEKMCMKYMK